MNYAEEIAKNKGSQATITQRLHDLETTKSVFIQEALRLEGELRLLEKLQKEAIEKEK